MAVGPLGIEAYNLEKLFFVVVDFETGTNNKFSSQNRPASLDLFAGPKRKRAIIHGIYGIEQKIDSNLMTLYTVFD